MVLAQIRKRDLDFSEEMSFGVHRMGFACRAKVEVRTIIAVPADTEYRILTTLFTPDTSVDIKTTHRLFLSYVVHQALDSIAQSAFSTRMCFDNRYP